MSFAQGNKRYEEQFQEKSPDDEETYQTDDEGNSDESISHSITKLKQISIEETKKVLIPRKKCVKKRGSRVNVSLRYTRHNRRASAKNTCRKFKERRMCMKYSAKSQNCPENTVEVSQKGKRCRLGGKAKGKPPEEESCEKCDSDEESDTCYLRRISLGYFQKYRDKSGASTSYELDKYNRSPTISPLKARELTCENSEELELLELQQWGITNLVSSYHKGIEELNSVEDADPDTF